MNPDMSENIFITTNQLCNASFFNMHEKPNITRYLRKALDLKKKSRVQNKHGKLGGKEGGREGRRNRENERAKIRTRIKL